MISDSKSTIEQEVVELARSVLPGGTFGNVPHEIVLAEGRGGRVWDMAGNVYEWCQDWYSNEQKYRVLRGGSWNLSTLFLHVTSRLNYVPSFRHSYLGFRCVVELP